METTTRDLNKANNVDLFVGFHELLDSANTAWTVPGILLFSTENLNNEQGWGGFNCSPLFYDILIPWPHRPGHTPLSPRDLWRPRWSRTCRTPAWTGDTRWGGAWSPGAPGSSEGFPCCHPWPGPALRYGDCWSLPSPQHLTLITLIVKAEGTHRNSQDR